jgi:hypothetical protein
MPQRVGNLFICGCWIWQLSANLGAKASQSLYHRCLCWSSIIICYIYTYIYIYNMYVYCVCTCALLGYWYCHLQCARLTRAHTHPGICRANLKTSFSLGGCARQAPRHSPPLVSLIYWVAYEIRYKSGRPKADYFGGVCWAEPPSENQVWTFVRVPQICLVMLPLHLGKSRALVQLWWLR